MVCEVDLLSETHIWVNLCQHVAAVELKDQDQDQNGGCSHLAPDSVPATNKTEGVLQLQRCLVPAWPRSPQASDRALRLLKYPTRLLVS